MADLYQKVCWAYEDSSYVIDGVRHIQCYKTKLHGNDIADSMELIEGEDTYKIDEVYNKKSIRTQSPSVLRALRMLLSAALSEYPKYLRAGEDPIVYYKRFTHISVWVISDDMVSYTMRVQIGSVMLRVLLYQDAAVILYIDADTGSELLDLLVKETSRIVVSAYHINKDTLHLLVEQEFLQAIVVVDTLIPYSIPIQDSLLKEVIKDIIYTGASPRDDINVRVLHFDDMYCIYLTSKSEEGNSIIFVNDDYDLFLSSWASGATLFRMLLGENLVKCNSLKDGTLGILLSKGLYNIDDVINFIFKSYLLSGSLDDYQSFLDKISIHKV